MKKLLSLSLLFIYLFTASGVIVTYHYCCGKFSSVELYSNTIKVEKKCWKKERTKGCCESKTAVIKVKDNSLKASTDFSLKKVVFENNVIEAFHSPLFKQIAYQQIDWNKAPPKSDGALYILFQALII